MQIIGREEIPIMKNRRGTVEDLVSVAERGWPQKIKKINSNTLKNNH